MGLFDTLSEDPKEQALLALYAGLLGNKGNFGQVAGQSMMGAMETLSAARKRQMEMAAAQQEAQLRKMQIQDHERQAKLAAEQDTFDERFRNMIPSPRLAAAQTALAAGGGPTVANAANMPKIDPMQELLHGAMQNRQIKPLDYVKTLQKDNTPIKVGKDDRLIAPGTFKELVGAAPEKDPEEIRVLKMIYGEGTPAYQQALAKLGEKKTTHQPGTSVNVKVENALGTGLAKEIGPMLQTSHAQATSAQQASRIADSIVKAVDSNKVISGPGATFRVMGYQIGQTLGVGGADAAEILLNTRSVIQGLAKSALAARGQLKGQGQVSDYEGKLLQKADAGNIEDMTAAEIKQVAIVNKRLAAQLMSEHKTFVSKVKAHKNTEISGLGEFFDINQPAGAVRTWNPATGQLED